MDAALDDYRWLVSDAARPWIDLARDELAAGDGPSVSLLSRLRKDLTAVRAHLVALQAELRQRAREKFTAAERMFFARQGLEQATDEQIAEYKASRFPAGSVADLCCGIGGDALSLARRGKVVAVDLDPVSCLFAEANARACGLGDESVRAETADAALFRVGEFAAWHIDPDRRPQGQRTSRVELFQPPLEAIESLLTMNPNAAIKLAPSADAPDLWQKTAELEWLGSRGECRQQVAWFGSLARHPGRRSATVVDASGGPRTIIGTGDEPITLATGLGRYLYEPHAVVLAAKLTGAFSQEQELSAISSGVAYLTSDALVVDAALAAFEVQEVLPMDRKQLRTWCREHRVGRLEVKKRGVDVDPEKLRKEIIAAGEGDATMIVTPLKGKDRAVIARRISDAARY